MDQDGIDRRLGDQLGADLGWHPNLGLDLAFAPAASGDIGGHDKCGEPRGLGAVDEVFPHVSFARRVELKPAHAVGRRSSNFGRCRGHGAHAIRDPTVSGSRSERSVGSWPNKSGEPHRRNANRGRIRDPKQFGLDRGVELTLEELRHQRDLAERVSVALHCLIGTGPAVEVLPRKVRNPFLGPGFEVTYCRISIHEWCSHHRHCAAQRTSTENFSYQFAAMYCVSQNS